MAESQTPQMDAAELARLRSYVPVLRSAEISRPYMTPVQTSPYYWQQIIVPDGVTLSMGWEQLLYYARIHYEWLVSKYTSLELCTDNTGTSMVAAFFVPSNAGGMVYLSTIPRGNIVADMKADARAKGMLWWVNNCEIRENKDGNPRLRELKGMHAEDGCYYLFEQTKEPHPGVFADYFDREQLKYTLPARLGAKRPNETFRIAAWGAWRRSNTTGPMKICVSRHAKGPFSCSEVAQSLGVEIWTAEAHKAENAGINSTRSGAGPGPGSSRGPASGPSGPPRPSAGSGGGSGGANTSQGWGLNSALAGGGPPKTTSASSSSAGKNAAVASGAFNMSALSTALPTSTTSSQSNSNQVKYYVTSSAGEQPRASYRASDGKWYPCTVEAGFPADLRATEAVQYSKKDGTAYFVGIDGRRYACTVERGFAPDFPVSKNISYSKTDGTPYYFGADGRRYACTMNRGFPGSTRASATNVKVKGYQGCYQGIDGHVYDQNRRLVSA